MTYTCNGADCTRFTARFPRLLKQWPKVSNAAVCTNGIYRSRMAITVTAEKSQ